MTPNPNEFRADIFAKLVFGHYHDEPDIRDSEDLLGYALTDLILACHRYGFDVRTMMRDAITTAGFLERQHGKVRATYDPRAPEPEPVSYDDALAMQLGRRSSREANLRAAGHGHLIAGDL